MRDIRSENYYEQMLGRARRTLSQEELIKSSPSAHSRKLGYVIVDAVGVTKSDKLARGKCGSDSKQSISFKNLLNAVVTGDIGEDTFSSLGTRIDRLGKILTDKENTEFKQLTGGIDIHSLANSLKQVHNTDVIEEIIRREYTNFKELSPLEQENVHTEILCKDVKRLSNLFIIPMFANF